MSFTFREKASVVFYCKDTSFLLCFTLLRCRDAMSVYKSKVCSSLPLSESVSAILPATFTHFVSLSQSGSSHDFLYLLMIDDLIFFFFLAK